MSKPQLPALTHLQFLVLGVLRNDDLPGRALREALSGYGIRRTGPAFYQLMARLEKDRLVDGRYEQITVGDQAVTERDFVIDPELVLRESTAAPPVPAPSRSRTDRGRRRR